MWRKPQARRCRIRPHISARITQSRRARRKGLCEDSARRRSGDYAAKRWPLLGIRPTAAISTCASLPTEHGFLVARPLAEREPVDGEVAPLGVGGDVAPERHLGPASVGLDVLAQRRRLDRALVDDERHGAVRDAGQRDLEPRRPRAANHFVGRRGGREVEIERRLAEREVAHCAADEARLLAVAVEGFERPRQWALPERRQVLELSVRQAGQASHSIRPGMRTPFSTWAGT
jgi:hypothetical protein